MEDIPSHSSSLYILPESQGNTVHLVTWERACNNTYKRLLWYFNSDCSRNISSDFITHVSTLQAMFPEDICIFVFAHNIEVEISHNMYVSHQIILCKLLKLRTRKVCNNCRLFQIYNYISC